jgi:hypothetical protein
LWREENIYCGGAKLSEPMMDLGKWKGGKNGRGKCDFLRSEDRRRETGEGKNVCTVMEMINC